MKWKVPIGLCLFFLSFGIGTRSDTITSFLPNVAFYALIIILWISGLILILLRIAEWYRADLHPRVEEKKDDEDKS